MSDVQAVLYDEAPAFIHASSPPPKISKGENYLGLPYVILDYPRIAKGDDLVFIRSLFWWGNFYSSTLQLAGSYRESYRRKIEEAYSQLAEKNYFIGVNGKPWVHHFEADNYKAINELSKEAFVLLLHEIPHIKIAARWRLNEWDSAANNLIESWLFLVSIIEVE